MITDDLSTENALGLTLTVSYLLWATLVGFQLLRHIVFRHQLVSFQFSFLLVCFVWLLFRCLWFVVDWSSTGSLTVALIVLAPEVCQIATFSLLVLYIAKLVHRRRWVEVRAGLFTCYVMSVSIMIVVAIFFAGLYDSQSQGGSGQQGLDQMYYFTSGTYFGALVAVAAYYIHKLNSSPNQTTHVTSFISASTGVVFVVFLSRSVFDFLSASGYYSIHLCHDSCQAAGQLKPIDVLPFAALILWELVPTSLVLIYFRHIPYTRLHRCHACELSLYTCCVQPDTGGVSGGGGGLPSISASDADADASRPSGEYGSFAEPSLGMVGDSSFVYEPFASGKSATATASESASDECFREDTCACCLPALPLLPCCACIPCCGLAPVSAVASMFAASDATAAGAAYAGHGPLADAAMDEHAETTMIVARRASQPDLGAGYGVNVGGGFGANQAVPRPPSMNGAAVTEASVVALGAQLGHASLSAGGAFHPGGVYPVQRNPFYAGHAGAHAVQRPAWDDHYDSDGGSNSFGHAVPNGFVVGGLHGAQRHQQFYRLAPDDPQSP